MKSNQMPAIQLSALSKQFGDVSAVDQLSLEVPSGTLFGFLGPNGAGKTTTIRMLLGLISPCSGTGKVMGYDIRTEADQIRARTGALLEHTVIYERMSAIDNLEFYGRIFRIPPADRLQRIKGLLQEMGLWDRRHDLAGSWSRGMKQRLALARVLLHKPKLVFLDEPTAGLDIVSAAKIREKLSRLVEKDQLTVFLTTHNMAEVEQICSQVSLIKEGKLIAQGSPDQLRSMRDSHRFLIKGKGLSDAIVSRLSHRPEIQFVQRINHGLELDIRDREKKSDLVTWLVGEGVHIEEIRQDQEKLEDVFITLLEEKNDH